MNKKNTPQNDRPKVHPHNRRVLVHAAQKHHI